MRLATLLLACAAVAASAAAEELRLKPHETIVFEVAGATAAFVVDATIADVSLVDRQVHVRGRRAGTTTLSVVVPPHEVLIFEIAVSPAVPAKARPALGGAVRAASDTLEGFYNSDTGRTTSSVSSTRAGPSGSTRLAATSVAYARQPAGDARVSLPVLAFEMVRGRHQVTLFDEQVGATGIERNTRTIRGAHYRSDRVELHAGLLSSALYRNFLFSPAFSSKVVSATYRFTAGRLTLAPHVSWNSSESGGYGVSGFAPTLQVQPTKPGRRLQFVAEAGYSNGAAAAGRIAFDDARHHAAVSGDHVPSGFPMPGGGPPPGTTLRGDFNTRVSPRLTLSLNVDGAAQQFVAVRQRTGSSNAEVRARLSPHWSVSTGTVVSVFEDDLVHATNISLPVEVSWSGARAGASALARYQQNSTRNRGGAGGRIRGHATAAGIAFSGSADYQRDAATVDLVFRDSPELAQLFTEVGLLVSSPEELLRLVQENTVPGLAEYLQRSSVNLSPWRLQSRAAASWTSANRSDSLQFSLTSDRRASTTVARDNLLATAAYTRRLGSSIDLIGSGTRWVASAFGGRARWGFTVGVRARFSGANGIASLFQRQVIRGSVFRDDAAGGLPAPGTSPMPSVRVVLDDGQETLTGPDGRFVFANVGRGPHRVDAILPSSPGLRFTTPSAVDVQDRQPLSFGIGRLPGRLIGQTRDDAGGPVPGVKILLVCAAEHFDTLSDSSGRYAIAAPVGPCSVVADTSSLPTGYAAGEVDPRAVGLASDIPARADYEFKAMRSLTGAVATAGSAVTLRHAGGDIVKQADAAGRFAFRNLSPGTYTVVVVTGTRVVERRVEIPAGPGLIDIDMRRDR